MLIENEKMSKKEKEENLIRNGKYDAETLMNAEEIKQSSEKMKYVNLYLSKQKNLFQKIKPIKSLDDLKDRAASFNKEDGE